MNLKDIKETRSSKGEGPEEKDKKMKKNENEILMLQYRIKRYQAMGNGIMSQQLNGKLQKLLAKQVTF